MRPSPHGSKLLTEVLPSAEDRGPKVLTEKDQEDEDQDGQEDLPQSKRPTRKP